MEVISMAGGVEHGSSGPDHGSALQVQGVDQVEAKTGQLSRPVPEVIRELGLLLESEVTAEEITPIVSELEAGYESVHESFGVAPQHEADVANMMGDIRQTLSDPRLEALGIVSDLAYPKEEADQT